MRVTSFFNILTIGPANPSCMYEYGSHKFCQHFENGTCCCMLYTCIVNKSHKFCHYFENGTRYSI